MRRAPSGSPDRWKSAEDLSRCRRGSSPPIRNRSGPTTDSPLAWDLQAIVTANALEVDDTSQLLALAAGLKAVLVEPQTGMAAWLQDASTAAARFGLLDS